MHAPTWLRSTFTGATNARNRHRLALGGLVLLALGLRLARLAFQPLWWDEGWSLYFATTGIGTMLELTAVDIHPPLYYLLLHLWTRLLGPGIFSVRLLSVGIGTATVPLLYLAGKRLLGRTGALLVAVFLLALSPFHIYYSQEVRMYGLVALLGLAATYFALQWDPEGWGVGPAIGYVLATAAALYTQYYAIFLLLALNLIVLIRWLRVRRSGRALVRWLGAQAAVILLFLPWLWYAGGKLLTYVRFKVSVEQDPPQGLLTYLGRHLAAFTWGHAEGPLADGWWAGLLPLALLVLALALLLWRRSRKGDGGRGPAASAANGRWLPAGLILTVSLLCGFVVNLLFPFNPPRGERLLLLALPAFLLLVAAGLAALWQQRRLVGPVVAVSFVAAAAVSLAFFYTVPRYPDDDYRPLVAQVRALGLPGDAIVCIQPWQVGYFQSYLPDDAARPALFLTPREVIPRERQLWADDPARMAAELDTLLAGHGRLWFPDHRAMGRVLEAQIEAYLVEHAYPVLAEWHGENTVLSFFATGAPLTQPVSAQFGEWLGLEGAALSPGPLEAGWGIVPVDLTWRLSGRPDEDYHVGLRLVDAAGHVWAQRDSAPRGGLAPFSEWPLDEPGPDRHGLLVPAGTPPGEYTVMLRVYRRHDLAVLPAVFEAGTGSEVALGTVHIVRPEMPPPLEALPVAEPLQADFGPLRLLGHTVHSESALLPGEVVEVDLFWQALADPGQDFLPRLQLLDGEGWSAAERTEKPVAGTYPTAWWQAGQLVRDPHTLPIPATVPPGRYRLALGLVRAADGALVETAGGQTALDLAEVEVLAREHNFSPTVPTHTQRAQFGPSVELTGYDLREAIRAPGSPLGVTLHWFALQTPDRNYHSFVHLLDAGGAIVAQHDGPPGEGEQPTLGWLPGEYVTDTHLLQLPTNLPDGTYRLGVGLYDPSTDLRLGERVLLDTPVPVQARGGCMCR
jgi:4-amino-4-deoxy-L-arabinose transferase-like glycosyltransferase